jgi:hypothetical protein
LALNQQTMTATEPFVLGYSAFSGCIGTARVDITPPVGIYARNWGAQSHDVADSIHRPLTMTALALAAGPDQPPLILIDADLGYWTTLQTFVSLQQQVLAALRLDSARFLFAMTHTHASPHLSDPMPEWQGGDILQAWLDQLPAAAILAAESALRSLEPGLLEWHTGHCQLASARDLRDPHSGDGRIICGYDPSTPADSTLLIGRVTGKQGEVRATIVNYACHPTTLAWQNHAVSPDYIGAMREVIETHTNGAPAFFLQGASGELAPRYQYVGDSAVADRHGRQLGYAALATLEDMEAPGTRLVFHGVVESGAPLAVWKPEPFAPSEVLQAEESNVELPLKNWPTADELDQQFRQCDDRAMAERLRRKRNIRQVLGDQATYHLPFWVWRVGDAIIIGSMMEAYSVFQKELRRRFPGTHIVCLNVVNGAIGYLTPSALYDQDVYQVWQTPFDRGSLEQYIEAGAERIRQLLDHN